jgi:crotonobetainyl-CoA:carnitine CoA-transferase CaiB-like acyl-CoA transferase
VLAGAPPPGRGQAPLAGGLICYRPYRCADGWVTFGALEPKFWQAWCAGVGRADLADRQFEPVGSDTHREVEAEFARRTRDEWRAFNDEHDCCVEPVLGLDEALAQAGDMVVESGAQRLLGTPVRLSRTPADPTRAHGPDRGGDTDAVLGEAGFAAGEIAALREAGAVA